MPLYERSVGFAVLLPSTITLASPRKRGGGTADIIFWLAVQYSDSPTFTILKLFRAVTVGIVNASEAFMLALLSISIPFDPHQPFQNRTIPRKLPTHLPPLSKVRSCRPKKFGRLPEGLPPVAPNTAIPIIISKVQSSLAPHHILSSIVKGEVLSDK